MSKSLREHQDKLDILREICNKENISLKEIAYSSDDINCKESLASVGVVTCQTNIFNEMKDIPNTTHLIKKGGYGAVREFVERVLK